MAKAINNSKAKLEAFEKANEILVPVPLVQPTPLINAIAELPTTSGPSFTPPPVNPPTTTPAVATIPYGYPIIQAQTIESGGLAVQRLETNGLFNLVSGFIKYWSQGGATKFDSTFGIAPGQGYTQGSVLYYADPTNPNNILNGWYTKLNNNADTTFPNTNWKQITNVTPAAPLQLYQQGRLTGVSGSPYGDTPSSGNRYLYFTPGYDGNLISLLNTTTGLWVTQSFSEVRLDVSSLSNGIDIYVSTRSSTTIGIDTTALNDSRQQLPNGKWVYSLDNTKLFVGSINVSVTSGVANSGVVQSWYGNRSIFNLYNQVSKPLQANRTGAAWAYSATDNTYWINQNLNASVGVARFNFIYDPLSNPIQMTSSCLGISIGGNNGRVGIICNTNLTTAQQVTPLSYAGYASYQSTMVYNYTFFIVDNNNKTPNSNFGLNYIQKIEGTFVTGNFQEYGGGLFGEYWG